MGRNKYPKQTLEKIISTAARLFVEKGYEQTSVQDILDEMKLSKGGLYHHFKSKEEILDAVLQKRADQNAEMFHELIRHTEAENGRERLKKIICQFMTDKETHSLDSIMNAQADAPYFVLRALKGCVLQDARLVSPLIEEGVADGSIQTDQPGLGAEVFLLLLNFWTNPSLFGRTVSETRDRLKYIQSLMALTGIDIIDDEMIDRMIDGYAEMGGSGK